MATLGNLSISQECIPPPIPLTHYPPFQLQSKPASPDENAYKKADAKQDHEITKDHIVFDREDKV